MYVDGHAWEVIEPLASKFQTLYDVINFPWLNYQLLEVGSDVTISVSVVSFLGWLLSRGVDIIPELRLNAPTQTLGLFMKSPSIERG